MNPPNYLNFLESSAVELPETIDLLNEIAFVVVRQERVNVEPINKQSCPFAYFSYSLANHLEQILKLS